MTPQLMQAIKLLQLSNLDLVAYVEAELERNPLLDRGADAEPPPAEATGTQSPDKPEIDGEALNGHEFEGNAPAKDDRIDNRLDDTSPDENEFDPAADLGDAGRIFGMGRHRLGRPRRRRL